MAARSNVVKFARAFLGLARRAAVHLVRSGSNSAVHQMKNSTGSPLEADRVDCMSEPDDAGSVNGSFWDVATVDEIDAKPSSGSRRYPNLTATAGTTPRPRLST